MNPATAFAETEFTTRIQKCSISEEDLSIFISSLHESEPLNLENLLPVSGIDTSSLLISEGNRSSSTVLECNKGLPHAVSSPTIHDRTEVVVKSLCLVLEAANASKFILDELRHQLCSYLDFCSSEVIWLTRVKHMLTYPLAKYLNNKLPKLDDEIFTPTGHLRNFLKCRYHVFSRTNTWFWYSWLQAKRGTLPVSEDVVSDSYRKHLKALTSTDPGKPDTIRRVMENPTMRYVLKKFRASFRAVLDSSRPFYEFTPSNSACFESTRSCGGQSYELKKISSIPLGNYYDSELDFMTVLPSMFKGGKVSYNVLYECRQPFGGDNWKCLRESLGTYDFSKELDCTIQAVLEPCKVRIISKGEALPYYASKPIQIALWKSLQLFDCFELTGRPLSPTDLFRLRGDRDWEWFSVDYSGATDGLSLAYSQCLLEYVIEDLPYVDQELMRRVLGPHNLYYPDHGVEGGRYLGGLQTNGQLMGSPLSFPFLCLANLGVFLLNTEGLYASGTSPKSILSKVLINGDDMLYSAPSNLWERHAEISSALGLEMTVGKAYCHPIYLNANSTCYHYDHNGLDSVPFMVPFLNSGLFFGRHKVMKKEESSVCSVMNKVLDGCINPRMSFMICSRYLSLHHDQIREECMIDTSKGRIQRNLFLPISLGGMGVIAPRGWKFYISGAHRFLMKKNLYWKRYSFDALVDSGEDLEDLSDLPPNTDQVYTPLRDSVKKVYKWTMCPYLSAKSCPQGFPLRVLPDVEAPWNISSHLTESTFQRIVAGSSRHLSNVQMCDYRVVFPNRSCYQG
jgi:hypothetical protein